MLRRADWFQYRYVRHPVSAHVQDGRGAVWFGLAFRLALVLHAAVAGIYPRARPRPDPVRRRVVDGPAG